MVRIKDRLQQRLLDNQVHYEREEILWMLDYIGHPDYKIRDELIFVSLARAIQEQLFTKDQFDFVVIEALKRQGLLYKKEEVGQATLTRSFTALLFANLLHADAKKNSLYFKRLSSQQRMALFEQGLSYLLYENDRIGYSEEYGWVHAFAHGADLLVEIICHPDFPIIRVNEVLQVLDFPLEKPVDFLQFSNARSCLLEVYLQLDKEKALSDELREAIQLFSY